MLKSTPFAFMIVLTVLTVLMSAVARAVPDRDTRAVAEAYLDHAFLNRDIQEAAALLAEDVLFTDPTAAVFGGPLAVGVTGREAVLELQRGWNIIESDFEIDVQFVCGEYACFAGALDYQAAGRPAVEDLPFMTILTIREGLIVERFDLGDYTRIAAGAVVPERHLSKTAKEYLLAYLQRDFEALSGLLDDDAVFQDPTSALLGAGRPREGRAAIVEVWRNAFEPVLDFDFESKRTFFFQHHAVFAGSYRYAMTGAAIGEERPRVTFEVPGLVVLEIREGRIVKHLDYADYETFRTQVEAYTKTDE